MTTDTWPPAASTNDPATAHQAAEDITKSGKRKLHVDICYEQVCTTPGKTAGEYGELTGLGHVPAQRRLSDLKNLGRIYAEGTAEYQGKAQDRLWPTLIQGILL